MHYTSLENIHKLIDPLFLNELNAELERLLAAPHTNSLKAFQRKLGRLKFLDPACGSGNFLTETYICLRRMENKILKQLFSGQKVFDFYGGEDEIIKVSIDQFYGIEINDFAVTVARTALWIAESQMIKETEDIVHTPIDFLPLRTNAHIVKANALQIDWESVIPRAELSFILGNPPFVGKSFQNPAQKKEMASVFTGIKSYGNLDYVACWYKLAADYIKDTGIKCAFVSTNSICQGIAVPPLWTYLLKQGMQIFFAYKTFVWESEAVSRAAVHCVIVGFSAKAKTKYIYSEDHRTKEITRTEADNINPYLMNGPNIIVESRKKMLCNSPLLTVGSCPCDNGNLLLSAAERRELLEKEPQALAYIRPYIGGEEFINASKDNNLIRYCLWLKEAPPSLIKQCKFIRERVEKVRSFRLASKKEATIKKAETPTLFTEDRYTEPTLRTLFIPMISSENRNYIPIGYVAPEVIASNLALAIPDADLYVFGVLNSNVHMAWTRTIGSRMKSDYRYGAAIVYNTFPWPAPTQRQKRVIETAAQQILDIRQKYFDSDPKCSYAALYDKIMPPDLLEAHRRNDKAVMEAYGFDIKSTTEESCVLRLLEMYRQLVSSRLKTK